MRTAQWLLIALLGAATTACGMFSNPEKQRAEAEAAMARGEFGDAAVTLRNLIDDDADNASLRLLLARTLFMQGDVDGARRTLQAAATRGAEPSQVAATEAEWNLQLASFRQVLDATADAGTALTDEQRRYFRARALQGLQRAPEALAIYQELATARPDSADLQLRIAQCHVLLGRLDAARAAADRAIEMDAQGDARPVRAEAWMLKAGMAAEAGDVTALRQALDQAVEAAPGELSAIPYSQLMTGAIEQALRANDLDTARRYHAQLARAMPQSPLARTMAARLGLFEADPANAVAELQRLLQERPDDAAARLLLAAAQLRAGSFEQALAEVGALTAAGATSLQAAQEVIRAASVAPAGSLERAAHLAAAFVALQEPPLARLELDKVDADAADHPQLLRARAQVELRNGRPGEAIRLAQQLASRDAAEPQDLLLLAEAQVANRDHAAAAATYERLSAGGSSAALAMAHAQARRRAGIADPDKPLRDWLQRHPDDHAVRLTIAGTLEQQGEDAAAARELERALAGLPEGHSLRAIALNNLAVIQARTNPSRALATARQAYQLGGSLPEIQDTYGWLLVRNGRAEEGLPPLESAAQASAQSAEVRYHYAAALAAAGESQLAAIYLADLLQHDGEFEGRNDAERLHASL